MTDNRTKEGGDKKVSELQFWTRNHKKILRVQQSMNGPYRVVSINPEDADTNYTSKYTVPAWANSYLDKADAVKALRFHAECLKLEKYEKKAVPAAGTAESAQV